MGPDWSIWAHLGPYVARQAAEGKVALWVRSVVALVALHIDRVHVCPYIMLCFLQFPYDMWSCARILVNIVKENERIM